MKCAKCNSEWNAAPNLSLSIATCPFCGSPLSSVKPQYNTTEEVLLEIKQQYGAEILTHGSKLLAYFADLAPQLGRQRRILGYFIECDGPNKMAKVANSSPETKALCVKQLVRLMSDELFINEEASNKICLDFLRALGCNIELPVEMSASPSTDLSTTTYALQKEVKSNGSSASSASPVLYSNNHINCKDFAYSHIKKSPPTLPKQFTESGIQSLIEQHDLTFRYYCKKNNAFYKKIVKAATAYAAEALSEDPLLLEDHTVFGSCKQGFVLTSNGKIYYSTSGGTGVISTDAIKDIVIQYKFGLYYICFQVLTGTFSSNSKIIDISYTSDEDKVRKMDSFWKKLLHL